MEPFNENLKIHRFKVLVVGEPNAGKTSFVNRYVHDTFKLEREITKGVDYASHTFQWDKDTRVVLHFWDVAGQERIGTQSSIYFRGAHAAIVVYDVTDEASYTAVPLWKCLIDDNVRRDGVAADIPCILLANKIDLVTDRSEDFNPVKLNEMTSQCGFSCGIPITACNNYNIAQSVKKLVSLLLDHQKDLASNDHLLQDDDDMSIKILDGDLPTRSSCRC